MANPLFSFLFQFSHLSHTIFRTQKVKIGVISYLPNTEYIVGSFSSQNSMGSLDDEERVFKKGIVGKKETNIQMRERDMRGKDKNSLKINKEC